MLQSVCELIQRFGFLTDPGGCRAVTEVCGQEEDLEPSSSQTKSITTPGEADTAWEHLCPAQVGEKAQPANSCKISCEQNSTRKPGLAQHRLYSAPSLGHQWQLHTLRSPHLTPLHTPWGCQLPVVLPSRDKAVAAFAPPAWAAFWGISSLLVQK